MATSKQIAIVKCPICGRKPTISFGSESPKYEIYCSGSSPFFSATRTHNISVFDDSLTEVSKRWNKMADKGKYV